MMVSGICEYYANIQWHNLMGDWLTVVNKTKRAPTEAW